MLNHAFIALGLKRYLSLEKGIRALYLILDSSGADLAIPDTENITLSLASCNSMILPIAFCFPKYFFAVFSVRIIELLVGNGFSLSPSKRSKSKILKKLESTILMSSLNDCFPVLARVFKLKTRHVDSISAKLDCNAPASGKGVVISIIS